MGATPLTADQIALVKATVPVLEQHGEAITTVFYGNMLAAHPELRNVFSASGLASGRQPRALAGAVLAFARHVDHPEVLLNAISRIAHKHVSLGVSAAQYAIVGKYLLEGIAQVLGPAVATPEILTAWAAAYEVLAAVFIDAETRMYTAQKAAPGGWSGFRPFQVVKRVVESQAVTSLYLAPCDATMPLSTYLPGQFVTVRVAIPSLGGLLQARQYSLSQAPRAGAKYYRISVKRDADAGAVSAALHGAAGAVGAVVEVSPPQGDFCLDPSDSTKEGVPVVLVSAGIGATPVMAMLEALARPMDEKMAVHRPVTWIHGSRSSGEMSFGLAVRELCSGNAPRLSTHIFLNQVGDGDLLGNTYHYGPMRTNLAKLNKERDLFVNDSRAEYFICGPESFMADMRRTLIAMGVDQDRVRLELFGSGNVED